jgi:hypothetical protein
MPNDRRQPKQEPQMPDPQQLGLELFLQRPDKQSVARIQQSCVDESTALVPEVDADGDHVHFEMVPMSGESHLWLTIRRETTPELAASSLRKIADLINQHGAKLLNLLQGKQGSFNTAGDLVAGPLRLRYDENGDIVIPDEDAK